MDCRSKIMPPTLLFALLIGWGATVGALHAEETSGGAADAATNVPDITDAQPAPGHSLHGEVFDAGPRQQARQMAGMGNAHLKISADSPLVQELFDQGLCQLHGFWYFEAERSFRQAATIEPECAMAYWGMAMANFENEKRATGFIEQAVKHKGRATPVEALWIDGLDAYIRNPGKADRKTRWKNLVKSFEKIADAEPDNVEPKAFLAWALWRGNTNDLPIVSYEAIDALLQQVLTRNPSHPGAHHYVIHLWDQERPARALKSAAQGGQSAPGIAHLWHMPGHTYSNLKRYADAVWQQEAANRVDHAYMQRDRVLPYQIHNYAHNHEWLIRNLGHLGRARDALRLSQHLIDLPRHPEWNNPAKGGSCAAYGKQRLLDTLTRFEMWNELLAFEQAGRFEWKDEFDDQVKRHRLLGAAHLGLGDVERGREQIVALEVLLAGEAEPAATSDESPAPAAPEVAQTEATPPADVAVASEPQAPEAPAPAAQESAEEASAEKAPAEEKPADEKPAADKGAEDKKAAENAKRQRERRRKQVETALAELRCRLALIEERHADALEQLKLVGDLSKAQKALIHRDARDFATAEQLAREAFEADRQQAQPLAVYVDVLASADKMDEANAHFEVLRPLAAQADIDLPAFRRVGQWAATRGIEGDWRIAPPPADDVGDRPELESLGPLFYQPWSAPAWSLLDAQGSEVSLSQYAGKPVVIIFYLGLGCLHCVEQLHAFAPLEAEFRAAGIELVAISTDNRQVLAESLEKFRQEDGTAFPIRLAANPLLDVFKSYRAFDDFENQALHGTFLIDGEGVIRWQDISYQPFDQPKFLLDEVQRLLRQPRE